MTADISTENIQEENPSEIQAKDYTSSAPRLSAGLGLIHYSDRLAALHNIVDGNSYYVDMRTEYIGR